MNCLFLDNFIKRIYKLFDILIYHSFTIKIYYSVSFQKQQGAIGVSNQNERSEELFNTLKQNKKKKKRKLLRTVISVIVIVAILLVCTVIRLRKRVDDKFAVTGVQVLTYKVSAGTLHSLVSGSGTLEYVDLETLTVPTGVEITEVIAQRNQQVKQGDLLATVDMSTVLTSLADLQDQLDELDKQIADAKGDTVSTYVQAGVSGRVKQVFAAEGMDVSACMAQHGALAILSLDGYMALDVESDRLERGDSVTLVRPDGTEVPGTVDTAVNGRATILLTDNGPVCGETVTVLTADGLQAGTGELYIHSPLAVTGYAGTVSLVHVKDNSPVYNGTTLFSLKNTSFTANYDTLLRQRSELEVSLLELLTIYRDGAILSPMDGFVSAVDYTEEENSTLLYSTVTAEETETKLLTLYPNVSMSVTIGIDEADILNLEVGQEAAITVSSVSEDTFRGTVTKINKDADVSTGVTQYSAEVLLDRTEGMLPGMTASVDITIEGVENALIIPVDALHQTQSNYFVYTGYDPETQQYHGMENVTVGMQNSEYAEILSGLKMGDTVYYTEQNDFFFGFSFGNMGTSNNRTPQMPGGMGGKG